MYLVQINEETSQQHEWNNEHWNHRHCCLKLWNDCGVDQTIPSRKEICNIHHTNYL